VPRVYPAASAAKVLTLERLYGTSLTDLEVRARVRVRVRVRAPRSPTSR
jgi:predicted unusual protein kinase regulating ubiquinone biosynthesis (AarF/ABC1/UbiB family)